MGLYETSCVLRQLSEQQSVHSRMQQQPSHQQPHHTVLEVAGADEDSEVAACSDHFAVERSQQPLQLNGRSSLSCHLRQTLQRLSHLSQVSRLGSLSLRSSASRITSGGLHSSYDSCKNDGVDGIAAADSGSFRRSEAVKLYQVLPPGLAGRAALFGNTLCMPEGWKCLDQPYFAAPGERLGVSRTVVGADRVTTWPPPPPSLSMRLSGQCERVRSQGVCVCFGSVHSTRGREGCCSPSFGLERPQPALSYSTVALVASSAAGNCVYAVQFTLEITLLRARNPLKAIDKLNG